MLKKIAIGMMLVAILGGSTPVVPTAPSVASASPLSYTLVCKGGGIMKAQYIDEGGSRWGIHIDFRKASVSATERQPMAGECAWIDRAFDAQEPAHMSLTLNNTRAWLNFSSSGVSVYRFVGDKWRELEYLVNGITRGEIFYVQVHLVANSDGAAFIIDRIGP